MVKENLIKTPAPSNVSYRVEIDGLRALAVVAVIINHFNEDILPSGYLGVDIFFVISGFVITSSIANRPAKNFRDFLIGFYVRRIKRLVPALVVFITINSVLISLFNPTPEVSLKTGATSLFGLSNLYLLRLSTDYFAASTKLNVFTHTWSLGVEEQFYILFPLIVWFTGFSQATKKGGRNLFITIGTFSAISLISFIYFYQNNQPVAYFLMPTRLWELGAGSLLFLGTKKSQNFHHLLTSISPQIITIALVFVLFTPLQFSVLATIIAVILTTILIGSIHPGTTAYNLFTQKTFVSIGVLSYSLYLWHWSVLSISRWTIGIYWWTVPLQLIAMILVSTISYKKIEIPLRYSKWSPSLYKTIGFGVSASLIASLFVALLYSNTEHISLIEVNDEMIYSTHWNNWDDCEYIETIEQIGGCKHLTNETWPLRIAVIGDSHAGHLASGLNNTLSSIPSSITVMIHAGCYPVINANCDLIQEAYKWVLDNPEIDLVVLSAYHNLTINKNRLYQADGDPNTVTDDAMMKLEEDLEASITALTSSGKSVLMIVDSHELLKSPELSVIPWSGLLREPNSLDISRQSVISRNQQYYDLLNRIEVKNSRFKVFYSGDVFCTDDICKSDIMGKPLFQSEDHLTPFGSQVLAAEYQNILNTLLSNH